MLLDEAVGASGQLSWRNLVAKADVRLGNSMAGNDGFRDRHLRLGTAEFWRGAAMMQSLADRRAFAMRAIDGKARCP